MMKATEKIARFYFIAFARIGREMCGASTCGACIIDKSSICAAKFAVGAPLAGARNATKSHSIRDETAAAGTRKGCPYSKITAPECRILIYAHPASTCTALELRK